MNKGISYIEVIISFMLLSLIAAGFTSAFYIPLSGIPPLEIKQIAYSYAQREMETVMNTPFERVNSISRMVYPLDNRFEYRIDVSSVNLELKSVWVRFYQGTATNPLAELMDYLVLKNIIEDFEVNGSSSPPFTWTPVSGTFGTWVIDNTLDTNTYRFHNPSTSTTEEGHTIPIWTGATNYSLEARVNLRRPDTTTTYSQAFLGVRCQANGDGYYFRITSNGSTTTLALIERTGGVDTVISGPLSFSANTTNIWLFARIQVIGNTIIYFFDYSGGTRRTDSFTDSSPLPSGGIRLRAISPLVGAIQRHVHFDNLKVEYFDSLTEDFEDNGLSTPPFTWTTSGGTWAVVPFAGSNVYRFSDTVTTWRASYPDWVGTDNYAVETRVYLFRNDTSTTASSVALGGRCTIAGSGYFLRVDVTPSTTTITLRSGTHTGTSLITTIPTISTDNFNKWLFMRLEMRGNTISFYFDDGTNIRSGSVANATYANGRVYLRASAQFAGTMSRYVYLDNLKIEY